MATKLNHIQQHLFAGLKKINVTEFQKTLLDAYEIEITEQEIQNYINVFKDEYNIKNSKELVEYILVNEICATIDSCTINKLKNGLDDLKASIEHIPNFENELSTSKEENKKLKEENRKLKEENDERKSKYNELHKQFTYNTHIAKVSKRSAYISIIINIVLALVIIGLICF